MAISATLAKTRLFLRALQRSPEPVRRKWQRIASAVTMTLVIVGWIFYLSISLTPAAAPAAELPGESGFFETLGKGFNVFSSSISEEWAKVREKSDSLWSSLGAQLANPSVFTFVREEAPIAPTPYETVSPVMLPISN